MNVWETNRGANFVDLCIKAVRKLSQNQYNIVTDDHTIFLTNTVTKIQNGGGTIEDIVPLHDDLHLVLYRAEKNLFAR